MGRLGYALVCQFNNSVWQMCLCSGIETPLPGEVMFDMGLILFELMPVDSLTKSIQETILLKFPQKVNQQ